MMKEKFWEKVSQCRKKTKRGDPLGFFNNHSGGNYQKIEGGPFGENFVFLEKVSQSRKYSKGVPFGQKVDHSD